MEKQLTKQQVSQILNSAPQNLDKKVIIQKLVEKGYSLEGFQQPQQSGEQATNFLNKSTVGQIFSKETAKELPKELYKATAGNALKFVKSAVEAPVNIVQGVQGKEQTTLAINDPVTGQPLGSYQTDFQNKIIPKVLSGEKSPLMGTIEGVGGPIIGALDVLGAGELAKGGTTLAKGGVELLKQKAGSIPPGGGSGGDYVVNKGKDIIKGVTENVNAPQSTKTSLNPFKTTTDISVSVPQKTGGYVLKPANKLTEVEKQLVQRDTLNTYETMLDRAKKFKVSREAGNSPIEVVGVKTDKAVKQVDTIRKNAGATMGTIEKQYANTPVNLKGNKIESFINEYFGNNKKFGLSTKGNTTLDEFANQYDILSKQPTVTDTLDFTRSWQAELDNLKDGFGQFKDNKRTYTVIEGALNDIKNNTRNIIAQENPAYREALSKYRLTSQLRDEANRLLGKDGLIGQRLKGGAVAKRAVQSSSDAGARQFYTVLKDLTGYNGIKDAEIALQAMKDVGDYQGLSLSEAVSENSSSLLSKAISRIPGGQAVIDVAEAGVNKLLPAEKRTRNLIKSK